MFSIGTVRVPFAVWIRDVDESGSGDDLDAAYEQGERALATFSSARWRVRHSQRSSPG
ncbi:hypothetical protein [Streptomyces tendae]|uniref:hypothetical protein n=1 Tax=Streptomyces tendae TaxID=1932 RepID=UPI0036A9F460